MMNNYILRNGMEIPMIGLGANGIWGGESALESELAKFSPRPIISSAIPLNLPNSYTILTDSKKTYLDIVSHLKNEHGCKKLLLCRQTAPNL